MDRVCQQKEGGALYEQILLNNQGMSDEPRARRQVTKSCPQEGCFDRGEVDFTEDELTILFDGHVI